MSEGQSSNATLSENREPSAQDVDLVHRIVVRAQEEPHATDRDSLIAAYEAVFKESDLDPNQDEVCLLLLFELLRPGNEGRTLLERFYELMTSKGIQLVFDEDASTQDVSLAMAESHLVSRQPSLQSGRISRASRQSSQDITDLAIESNEDGASRMWVHPLDVLLNNPPHHVIQYNQIAQAHNRKVLLREAMNAWLAEMNERSRSRNLVSMQNYADRLYEYKLKYKVTTHWRNVQQQVISNYTKADHFCINHKSHQALTNLLDSARVNRIQAMEDTRLRGMGLYKMTIAGRENAFCRKLDNKVKQRYLSAMVKAFRNSSARSDAMDGVLVEAQSRSNTRLMQSAVALMFHTSQQHHRGANFAHEKYNTSIVTKVFHQWTDKVRQILNQREMVKNTHTLFLMRKYFSKIKEVTDARKLRRLVLSRWSFKRWREYVSHQKNKRINTLFRTFRKNYKMKLATKCLNDMQSKVQLIAQMQQAADDHRDAKLRRQAHAVVVLWYNRSQSARHQEEAAIEHARRLALKSTLKAMSDKKQQIKQLERIAPSFHELHVQGVASQCLKKMRRKTFELRRRQADADAFRSLHDRPLARNRMDEWRQSVAQNRGEGPLILPPATPAQRRADQLNRLASTTPLLGPRVSFTARLRGEARHVEGIEEEFEEDK